MRLQEKTAIITGGGSGIGLAYCRRFLDEGANVMVADIGEEQGLAAVEDLSDRGNIAFIKTNIADDDSARGAVEATVERFGKVDILLNNAAVYGDYNPADNSVDYLRHMFDVNCIGQWLMARHATPHMVAQRWGRVINIASIAGYLQSLSAGGDANDFQLSSFSYQWTKFGVLGLTRHMAGQLGQFNVTCNAIAPGLTDTPATEKQVPVDFQPMFAQMSPMGRNTEPDDMVGPAVFFASDDSRMVNGQVMTVDGGTVMPV